MCMFKSTQGFLAMKIAMDLNPGRQITFHGSSGVGVAEWAETSGWATLHWLGHFALATSRIHATSHIHA